LFEQFKENLSLAREFAETARAGLKSALEAWRKATPSKRAVWLLVPTAIVASAVADHFSIRWYYQAAMLLLVAFGSWTLGAMRRKLQ
jgi:6-phosphogluconate dehydrogenase (decarboxylating)